MQQCRKCGGETADLRETCDTCGAAVDGTVPADCLPESATIRAIGDAVAEELHAEQVSEGERPTRERGENGGASGNEAERQPQLLTEDYVMSLLAGAADQAERRRLEAGVGAADLDDVSYVRAVVVDEGELELPLLPLPALPPRRRVRGGAVWPETFAAGRQRGRGGSASAR